jgi:hypothetical protein
MSATVAAVLTACGTQNPGGPDLAWTQVHEQTSCEALKPNYCTGLYGFTVTSDGRYTVGPSANAVQIDGTLSESERIALSSAAATVAGGAGKNSACDPDGTVPGVGDFVDLTNDRQVVSRVYELTFQGTCYRGGRDVALRLHADLRALMAKYYPLPFPPE